jgi:hypothetical protein
MSTRSFIILKVRKEDIGKVMKFNEGLLPKPLDKWQDKDREGKVWRDETGQDKCQPVEIGDQFIGIYCHWDGYPEGVGAELTTFFKDYNSVLNLILGGSCSAIDGGVVRHYANRQGEEWKYLTPSNGKSRAALARLGRQAWAEYAYCFDEATGWKYADLLNKTIRFKVMK